MKPLLLGAILFYVLLLWSFGWFASRRSRGSEGYLVAGRTFSTPFISALVAGTWIGGVSTRIGAPMIGEGINTPRCSTILD